MRKPKLYLETSVWNFLFADDAPDKKKATETFFDEIEAGKFDIFISETVRAEIYNAPLSKQKMLDGAIDKYKPVELELDEDVRQLAQLYLDNGVLTAVIRRARKATIREASNDSYFLEKISATFHGRDVFAPAAGHLARGVPLHEFGPEGQSRTGPRDIQFMVVVVTDPNHREQVRGESRKPAVT